MNHIEKKSVSKPKFLTPAGLDLLTVFFLRFMQEHAFSQRRIKPCVCKICMDHRKPFLHHVKCEHTEDLWHNGMTNECPKISSWKRHETEVFHSLTVTGEATRRRRAAVNNFLLHTLTGFRWLLVRGVAPRVCTRLMILYGWWQKENTFHSGTEQYNDIKYDTFWREMSAC